MPFSNNPLVGRVLSTCILGLMTLLVSSCSISTKPLYFENELAIAERATSRFHELHNAQNFEAIHALRDQELRTISAEESIRDNRMRYERLGKVVESELLEKKVLPSQGQGYTSQVQLGYRTKSEKGEWLELFAWNIKNGREAVLVQYESKPSYR